MFQRALLASGIVKEFVHVLKMALLSSQTCTCPHLAWLCMKIRS